MQRPSYIFLTIEGTLTPIDEVVTERYANGQVGEHLWQCAHGTYSETEIKAALADGRIAEIKPEKTYTLDELEALCREAFQAGMSYAEGQWAEAEFSTGRNTQPNEETWIHDNVVLPGRTPNS